MFRRNQYVRDLISQMRRLADRYGMDTVFTTFLELSATSMAAQMDPEHREEREKQYCACAAKLDPATLKAYASMLATLTLAALQFKDDPHDILGVVFHELNMHNEWKGQFFTSEHICRFMAQITIDQADVAERERPITIAEPACGSGAMILGTVYALAQQKVDYTSETFFVAHDIDIRCVWMAYIQLTLYGVPAVVIHGNTLTNEEWSRWVTPYAAIPFRKQQIGA